MELFSIRIQRTFQLVSTLYLHQFQEQSEAMQRNPHSYQIATGYRTFYSLSLIYQPITKKRLFL